MVLGLAEEMLAQPPISWDKPRNKICKASRELAKNFLEAWVESLAVAREGVSEETLDRAWVLLLEILVEEEVEGDWIETAQGDLWETSLAEAVSQVLEDQTSEEVLGGLRMLV